MDGFWPIKCSQKMVTAVRVTHVFVRKSTNTGVFGGAAEGKNKEASTAP